MLETQQSLEIYHPVLQEKNVFRTTVNTIVRRFPLLSEDNIVLFNGVLDHVGGRQNLLSMLFSVGLNTMDLCRMGSPLHLSIIHL